MNAEVEINWPYDKQAGEFLGRFGLKLGIREGTSKCPPWDDHKQGCRHGDQYRITLHRTGGKMLAFDWWGSIAMMQEGREPTPYDILACISSDANSPTDPDEVSEEFGGDVKPSQAIAIARFAARLQRFFTEEELEALSEIQ